MRKRMLAMLLTSTLVTGGIQPIITNATESISDVEIQQEVIQENENLNDIAVEDQESSDLENIIEEEKEETTEIIEEVEEVEEVEETEETEEIKESQENQNKDEKEEVIKIGWHKINSKYFYYENGECVKGWKKLGNDYYYLDKNTGEMKTGWYNDGFDYYFLDNNTGVMKTGWYNDGYDFYYLDSNTGAMKTGWYNNGQDYYYLDSNTGAMKTGWYNDGHDFYLLDKNTGAMKTGWYNDGQDYYYLDSNTGAMKTGWYNDGVNYYYLDENAGDMKIGRHNISGIEYWLNEDGTMKADEWIGDTFVDINGKVTQITREMCRSDVQYKMFKDMTSLENREKVHNRAIALHNGATDNNCVFFMSEILRRAGVSIPNKIGYTTHLEKELKNRGWKKRTDLENLKPGDIVYAGANGYYSHVYMFMGWAEDGYVYIVDNQKSKFGSVLHKRKLLELDEKNDTDKSMNFYSYE